MFLDVYSTALNNGIPQIVETNRWLRRADGHCDLPKLIAFKIGLFALFLTAAALLYFKFDAGVIAFAVFPMMGIVHVPPVLKNFQLHRKYAHSIQN